MIKYAKQIDHPKKTLRMLQVMFDEADQSIFDKGVVEILGKRRRLYFDIELNADDKVTLLNKTLTREEWLKFVIDWLIELGEAISGTFAAAGYITDENLYTNCYLKDDLIQDSCYMEYKNDENLHHIVSMHVVYYKVIKSDLLNRIMTSDTISLPKGVDTSVYTVNERSFRHIFSNKIYDKITYNTALNKDNCFFKASSLFVTPDDGDKDIDEEAFMLFLGYDPVTQYVKEMKKREDEFEKQLKRLEYINDCSDNKWITENFVRAVTDCLTSMTEKIHSYPSPVDKEPTSVPIFAGYLSCINDNVSEEFVRGELAKIQKKCTENLISNWGKYMSWAERSYSVDSFRSLIATCKKWNPICYELGVLPLMIKKPKFNTADIFTTDDMEQKGAKCEYQQDDDTEKLDYHAVVYDLQRCMITINKGAGIFGFKEMTSDSNSNQLVVNYYNYDTAMRKLKQIIVGTELTEGKNPKTVFKSAYDIYSAGFIRTMFSRRRICFYSNDNRDFSLFQGYKYNKIQNDELIKPFLEHIKHVICSDNELYYKYIQTWFSTIIKKPLNRAFTAIVIKGEHGTGKNTLTDVWAELLSGYSIASANVDTVFGRFNAAIEGKKFINIDEMQSANLTESAVYDNAKKYITGATIDIEAKGVDVRAGVENLCNFCFTSNNFNPIKIEDTDRRYFIITTSSDKRGDFKYFNELYKVIKPDRNGAYNKEFMEALMYYYTNYSDTVDLNDIPETLDKIIAKEINRTPIEEFIEAKCVELSSEEGILTTDAYQCFNEFKNEYAIRANYKLNTFKAEMKKYCELDKDANFVKCYKRGSDRRNKRVMRFNDNFMKKYSTKVKQMLEEAAELNAEPSVNIDGVESP